MDSEPEEILPGVFHWTARHPRIGADVSSYLLAEPGVLLDPMLPPGGLDWLRTQGDPAEIVLTNRHHTRETAEIISAFDCPLRVPRSGLHEVQGLANVVPYEPGDEIAGAIHVHEVGAISPDEMALHVPASDALACADGLVRFEPSGPLQLVPDDLMSDDPEGVKDGLRAAYRGLLDLSWDALLLAHGDPVVGGAKEALRAFLDA